MAATQIDFEGSDTIGNPSGRGRQSLMHLPGKVETDTLTHLQPEKSLRIQRPRKGPQGRVRGGGRGVKGGKNQEDMEFCICNRSSSSFLPSFLVHIHRNQYL